MTLRSGIIVVLSVLEVCKAYAPAANPPMLTHASMDVGNIISIVIPESPDENINVDQLTGEFRQQLERIKKQSRASKVEHGLVTLKRVLPEMSREEKRKTLPLIRRVLHGRRVSNPSGNARNWTREARFDQTRDGGQYMRSRSAVSSEERRILRDYEDLGNREAVTSRSDLGSVNREDYRRISERAFANRREDFTKRDDQASRENAIRRNDNTRQEELLRREDTERRDDRVAFPDEEIVKIARPLQDWNNQNWDDQTRGEIRVYPETSTIDCGYKLDRTVRQKDPVNEILQSEKFDKVARLADSGMANTPEQEMSADSTKINQRVPLRYSAMRPNGIDNAKRNVKDFRGFEPDNVVSYVNVRRDYDINMAINPNCDDATKNHSSQFLRDSQMIGDPLSNKVQPQRSANVELEEYRVSQKIVQEPREQFEHLNASGFENIASDSLYNLAIKKKRGDYYQDTRGFGRWNAASYDNRQPVNSSDEPRDSPNLYEMFGEKPVYPGQPYLPTEQRGFQRNIDNERKTLGSQATLNYGNADLALRIQRATNVTSRSGQLAKLNGDKSLFERLKRLLKSPQSPYNRVILVYGNGSESHDEEDREPFTEAEKSQFTLLPSMAEPSSSTSHDLPRSDRPMIYSPRISATSDESSKIIPTIHTI